MLFMLRTAGEMMLAFLSWAPWLGLADLAVVAIVTMFARRRPMPTEPAHGFGSRSAPPLLTLGLLLVPLLMLAWGLHFWPDEGRGAHERFAMAGLYLLAICELALCITIVWRARGSVLAGLSAGVALWWAAGALATASMAVTNTWL
jgi:hypothetical protein